MANENSLERSLSTFVEATGVRSDGVIRMGSGSRSKIAEPSAEQRNRLLADLARAGAGSRTIVWVWVALIVALFALAAGFAIYHRDEVRIVAGSILGGSGIMVVLLTQVRSVHKKLVATQILLALLPNLPPEQWVKSAMVLLNEILKTSPGSRTAL